jgi:hypothetical protein
VQAPRLGPLLALLALVIAAALALRSCGADGGSPPPPLTAAALDSYLRVAPAVRRERHRARAEGQAPSRWHERPGFEEALRAVGWELADYLRVEGQVAAARLAVEDPALFAREFRPEDAPPAAVELVRLRLDDVRRVQAPVSE